MLTVFYQRLRKLHKPYHTAPRITAHVNLHETTIHETSRYEHFHHPEGPSRLFQVKTYVPKPTLLTSVITDELCLLFRAEYHYVWLLSLNTLVLLNISIANAFKSLNNIPLNEQTSLSILLTHEHSMEKNKLSQRVWCIIPTSRHEEPKTTESRTVVPLGLCRHRKGQVGGFRVLLTPAVLVKRS